MCGFIGAINLVSGAAPKLPCHLLETELLGSRGPDEQYEFGDKDSFLRFHRLALVGQSRRLSELQFPSDTAYCLLNGTLHGLAAAYSRDTDHEALARHFDHLGPAGLATLDGGFAAVIKQRNLLNLITDATGEKSLYWTIHDKKLYYSTSSYLLAFLLHRPVRTGPTVVRHLILRGLPVGESYFEGIQQLPPGQLLRVHASKITQTDWTTLPTPSSESSLNADNLADSIAQRMLDARCAVALSGGIDSAALTCIGYQRAEIRTAITIRQTDDADFSRDARYAAELTKGLPNLQLHHARIAATNHIARDFPILDQDEFGLAGIAQRARELGCNALASGDGADELFCGYDRIFRFAHKLVRPLSEDHTNTEFLNRYAYTPPSWLAQYIPEDIGLKQYLAKTASGIPPLQGARRWFFRHHLFWLLRKLDFACGRHAIESRAPYLSRKLITFANTLGEDELLTNNVEASVKAPLKHFIQQISPGCVPTSILQRSKQAFPIREQGAEQAYQANLSRSTLAHAPSGVPPPLHEDLLDSPPGNQTRLRYLAYLSWKETCFNLQT